MALVLADRVQETTNTTGTGTLTLAGAVAGYQSFSAIGNANTTYYTIVSGTDWEVGIGTYTLSGTTLSRDTVLASSAAGAKISVAAGASVFCDYPAGRAVQTSSPTITGLVLAAGTSSIAPLDFSSGTNLATASAGAMEYDGAVSYFTNDTTTGRGFLPATQTFRLTSNGSAIGASATNFFGTNSNIPLIANGFYEIEIIAMALRGSTGGTVTWTLTNSAAPTLMVVDYEQSPLAGMAAPPGSVTALTNLNFRGTTTTTTAAYSFTTGTLTASVNHYFRFKIYLQNGSGTSLKLQLTAGTGNNSMTPLNGSVWFCRRLPGANTGTFAA